MQAQSQRIACAIYARKSTSQDGVEDEAKSTAVQVASARAFAAAKGWTIAAVYIDEAVSGADTKRLVQREKLLATIRAGAPFRVLVMRDTSRFSRRDGDESFGELKAITQAGVEVWTYQDAARFEHGTFAANVVGMMKGEMAAEYRRSIAAWTKAAFIRKVKAGHAVGGRVFGYDNVQVDGHVERRINPAQAAVVRDIYERCAKGDGLRTIAKALNATRVPCPRPQSGRPAGWSPSTILDVLRRPLYRGVVIWNQTAKRDASGRTAPARRAAAEHLTVAHPELRIVTDAQWSAAQTRRQTPKARTYRQHESQHLLSGFLRCQVCGGSVGAMSRSHGKRRAFFYGCIVHNRRGSTICPNAVVVPTACLDQAVLAALAGDILKPSIIKATVRAVFKLLEPSAVAETVEAVDKELKAVDVKIGHLTRAIEAGVPLAGLVETAAARQAERTALLARKGAAEGLRQIQRDRAEVERKVLAMLEDWRRVVTSAAVSDQRRVLREFLPAPLTLTPEGTRYRFEGVASPRRVVAGVAGMGAGDATQVASPTGFEPVFWP